MRLCGGVPAAREIEVLVREPATGAVLLQMVLRIPEPSHTHGLMRISSDVQGDVLADAPAENSTAVIGKIEARPGELAAAIVKWHQRCTARKLRCADEYRSVVRKAVREEGWVSFDDFEAGALGYLDAKVNGGQWKGTTYNRNLGIFKSFSKFQARLRKVADFLDDADAAEDDRDDKIRPATLDEARSLVKYAWMRAQVDKRAGMETAESLAVAFGMGLRPRECDKLRWKHLKHRHEYPHVWWTKDIQKNKREQLVPMSSEMAQLLEQHENRARLGPKMSVRVRKNRPQLLRPIDPNDPEAFVFGHTIAQSAFRKYVRACKLGGDDEYGRRLTPRSCRKFYKTEMKRQGVDGDLVRLLMRHKVNPDEGYFNPAMVDVAGQADRLPKIWPEAEWCASGTKMSVDNRASDRGPNVCSLTARKTDGTSSAGKPDEHTRPQPFEKPTREPAGGLPAIPAWSLCGSFDPLLQPVLCPGGHEIESASLMNPVMALPRFINEHDSTCLADLFGALERLLRSGAAHAGHPSATPGASGAMSSPSACPSSQQRPA